MLAILLTILKWILIVVLGLLGLILLVLILVLAVPVRYRASGFFRDGVWQGKGRISWLFPLICLSAETEKDAETQLRLRILGITVWPGGREREIGDLGDVEMPGTSKPPEDQANGTEFCGVQETAETETGNVPEPEERRRQKTAGKKRRKKKKQVSVIQKIRCFFRRIYDKLKQGKAALEQFRALCTDPENQRLVRLILRQTRKLIGHLYPGKGHGKIVFGFGDPYQTGQVLTWASLIYPLYARRLELCPMFDRKVLEGELWFRGRLRLGTLAWICRPVLFDKRFRKLIGW